MLTLLLIIIYCAFISLGLPDTVLGSVWPAMQEELVMPLSAAGILSMTVSCCTITSSLLSSRVIKRFGTGRVVIVSVALTAIALMGYAHAPNFWCLCVMALPLGFGAGAIDSGLNTYVAVHLKAKHMNWLHSFWGIGATLGPLIMSWYLKNGGNWRGGYTTIAIIQFVLLGILIISFPVWKIFTENEGPAEKKIKVMSIKDTVALRGAKPALAVVFCYVSIEAIGSLWSSSFMVQEFGLAADAAAKGTAVFLLGITLGRIASGFLTSKFNNSDLIRIGQILCLVGISILFITMFAAKAWSGMWYAAMGGIFVFGLGCAPIFPSMLHETPRRFGTEASQSVVGIQMACAYTGGMIMPPIAGLIAQYVGMWVYPCFLLVGTIGMLIAAERLRRVTLMLKED